MSLYSYNTVCLLLLNATSTTLTLKTFLTVYISTVLPIFYHVRDLLPYYQGFLVYRNGILGRYGENPYMVFLHFRPSTYL